MYTTLSPCDMCTGACLLYGIARVVIGENANFLGGEAYLRSRGVEVVVVGDARCKELMDAFITEKPELWWVSPVRPLSLQQPTLRNLLERVIFLTSPYSSRYFPTCLRGLSHCLL
jgi:tRNA(Arg) A34 adenosine deaminase TadA